jgi:alpha-glucosidase
LFFFSWQQGEQWIPEARLNPTQMLNYEFYSNPHHWSNGRRNAILHRWGGLGNHRYQVGFSGDVEPSWTALALSDLQLRHTVCARDSPCASRSVPDMLLPVFLLFALLCYFSFSSQPYFTATASNVLYSWWSHDLGGHLAQPAPDLYTRWVKQHIQLFPSTCAGSLAL